jgi:uncharacterized protein (TIGR03435 family)
MPDDPVENFEASKRHMWRISAILAASMMFCGQPASAQSSVDVAAWQTAAGGKMAFDVASIRPDTGPFQIPSFALSPDNSFREPNGRFHADFPLDVYIEFAYKMWPTNEEHRQMLKGWPSWVGNDRYDIEAVAPLHATKDQYRLMMQDMLANRFGLKVHFEQREVPVLAMKLIHPGKPGPRLVPHRDGLPCDAKPKDDTYPKECYSFSGMPSKDGLVLLGSRGTPLNLIADFIGSIGGTSGEIGRRVVDQTGLTGEWDFTLETTPPNQHSPETESRGPTMLEAIRDQLGIKLEPTRAVVPILVIDKVERPSEN